LIVVTPLKPEKGGYVGIDESQGLLKEEARKSGTHSSTRAAGNSFHSKERVYAGLEFDEEDGPSKSVNPGQPILCDFCAVILNLMMIGWR
jgi:hypothetical protein